MTYEVGDILLIKFPFTDLSNAKKRPVLVIQNENSMGDFVCFQITSKDTQSCLTLIKDNDLSAGKLTLTSYVKYDKCFTLNSSIVDKKIARVNTIFNEHIKVLFCTEIF